MRTTPFIVVEDAGRRCVPGFVHTRLFSHGIRSFVVVIVTKAAYPNDLTHIPRKIDADEVVINRVVGWLLEQNASDLDPADLARSWASVLKQRSAIPFSRKRRSVAVGDSATLVLRLWSREVETSDHVVPFIGI